MLSSDDQAATVLDSFLGPLPLSLEEILTLERARDVVSLLSISLDICLKQNNNKTESGSNGTLFCQLRNRARAILRCTAEINRHNSKLDNIAYT